MRITIVNGTPDTRKYSLHVYLKELKGDLQLHQHQVHMLNLAEMDIRYCRGCWGCWVKTPGLCLYQDDSHLICRQMMQSDFVLFASPLIMGFTSALLKKALDKMIPLIHPYLELVQKECHHRARYAKYPLLGLIVQKDKRVNEDDLKITEDIFRRIALNLRSKFVWLKTHEQSVEEVSNEIGSL